MGTSVLLKPFATSVAGETSIFLLFSLNDSCVFRSVVGKN